MTPAELRTLLERYDAINCACAEAWRNGRSAVGFCDEVEAIEEAILKLAPELLRLWEAADDMDPRALPLTMPWVMADSLDELEKIKP